MQSKKNEVKQCPSSMAQTTERHLLLSPPLSTFETSRVFPSHTKTIQDFQRLSRHMEETFWLVSLYWEHWERIFNGEAQGIELAQDDQGLYSQSSSSLDGTLSSRCWLFSGGGYLLSSGVCKDLLRKNDPRCKFLRRLWGVYCCICTSWRKSAVLKC